MPIADSDPLKDTYVSGAAPNTNYGTATSLQMKFNGADATWLSTIIDFNLSKIIGRGGKVNTALFSVNFISVGGITVAYEIARCTSGWGENTSSFNKSNTGIAWLGAGNIRIPGVSDTTSRFPCCVQALESRSRRFVSTDSIHEVAIRQQEVDRIPGAE